MPTLNALIPGSLTFEDLGEETDAFLVTGYDTAQSPQRRKISPIITTFMKRTEIWVPEVTGYQVTWTPAWTSGTTMAYSNGSPETARGALILNTLPYQVNFVGSDSGDTAPTGVWDNFVLVFAEGVEPAEPADLFAIATITNDSDDVVVAATELIKENYFGDFWRWKISFINDEESDNRRLFLTSGATYTVTFT